MTVGFLRAGGPERVKHGSLRLLQSGSRRMVLALNRFDVVAVDHTSGLLRRSQYGLSG
jgi:hypothetical protein